MWAGHLGAALALKRGNRDVNLGVLFLATQLADVVLWILVLAGVEHVTVPADYAHRHYFLFDFPYSHSLPATAAWCLVTFVVTAALGPRIGVGVRRFRAGGILAAAVFSHFFLDVLVHPAQPLPNGNSTIGIGLWDAMPIALALELGIVALGWRLFVRGNVLSRKRTRGLAGMVAIVSVLTVVGMTVAPAPTSLTAVAITSLVSALVVSAIAWRIDRS